MEDLEKVEEVREEEMEVEDLETVEEEREEVTEVEARLEL